MINKIDRIGGNGIPYIVFGFYARVRAMMP